MKNIENTFNMDEFDRTKENYTDTALEPEHKKFLDEQLEKIKEDNPEFDPELFLSQA